MTAPAKLDRAGFDALVQRRVLALVSAGGIGGDPAPAAAAASQEGQQEAQLLEAAAVSFADAVDRSDRDLPYDDAVVITGTGGVVVISDEEWRATPVYWEASAGEVDSLTQGSVFVAWLRGEPDSPAS